MLAHIESTCNGLVEVDRLWPRSIGPLKPHLSAYELTLIATPTPATLVLKTVYVVFASDMVILDGVRFVATNPTPVENPKSEKQV